MTDNELQQLVENISQTFFEQKFSHQAKFNSRLKTTGGRYLLTNHQIEINPRIVDGYSKDILVGVIKHELCHYHLHLNHQGYHHRDRDFKNLLAKVGGSRYAPSSLRPDPRVVYECRHCHHRFYRQRKINIQRFCCSRCGGRIKLISS